MPPLPPDLEQAVERLAERVHDAWARGRLADGWTVGERRDDAARTHPCLVPYAALDAAEREYDRATARAVVVGLLALGYRITAPDDTAPVTEHTPRS